MWRCSIRFRLHRIPDQPRTSLSGQEQPAPLQDHADFQTELRQKRDVNEGPRQPRQKTVQPNFPALHNGVAFPDYSHSAFVEISKRFRTFLSGDATTNKFASVMSLLHCNLSDAG